MTLERVMRYLFAQEFWWWTSYNKPLTRWYHDGFELLSQIRKEKI